MSKIDVKELPHLTIKSITGALSIAIVIYCISEESFGDVIAIIHTGPIFAVSIGCLFWGHKLNQNQLIALALSFAGCMIYVGSSVNSGLIMPALLMLIAACSYGVSLSYTSRIHNTPKTLIVLCYTVICGFLSLPFVEWQELQLIFNNFGLTLLILGSSAINILMNVLMIKAYRLSAIANLASISYLTVPFGFVTAYFLWGEVPMLWSYLIGFLIVFGGTLSVLKNKNNQV